VTDTTVTARGRTRITPRALDRVVSQVTAEELSVRARSVGVHLDDDGGALVLTVKAPMRADPLSRVVEDPSAVARGGGSMIDRAASARSNIRSRVRSLTGSDISRVLLRLTGVEVAATRRVR